MPVFAYFMAKLWIRIRLLFGLISTLGSHCEQRGSLSVESTSRPAYRYHTELYSLLAKPDAKSPMNFSIKLEGIFLSVFCRRRDI